MATGDAPNRSHPLPSGGGECEEGFHRLATGGYGDRWLRGMRRIVAIRCQAVEGSARKASTVWRQVATATGGYGGCAES